MRATVKSAASRGHCDSQPDFLKPPFPPLWARPRLSPVRSPEGWWADELSFGVAASVEAPALSPPSCSGNCKDEPDVQFFVPRSLCRGGGCSDDKLIPAAAFTGCLSLHSRLFCGAGSFTKAGSLPFERHSMSPCMESGGEVEPL